MVTDTQLEHAERARSLKAERRSSSPASALARGFLTGKVCRRNVDVPYVIERFFR